MAPSCSRAGRSATPWRWRRSPLRPPAAQAEASRPAFRRVLEAVAASYNTRRAEVEEAKTKVLRVTFEKAALKNALIIGAEASGKFALAARNLPDIDVLPIQGVNVYDIMRRDKLVLTRAAVEALEARFK